MNRFRKLLWPFSLVYRAVVYLRNKAYDAGLLPSRDYAVPVICVGNLSVGGSGKTPMVEWLLRYWEDRRVAVLSRGYRRQTRGFLRVGQGHTARDVGDEPLQLAGKFPHALVAVDANRRRGIETLMAAEQPEIILLDDGFQHRKVRPQASILLTAYDALYTDLGYLPSGDLRDHRSQARRADLIVVTKCPQTLSRQAREAVAARLAPKPSQPLLFATLAYGPVRSEQGEEVSLERLREAPVTLVTGIARPGPLVEHLRGLGLEVRHLRFPDHHAFSSSEIEQIRAAGRVLTTEKDAVRLGGSLDNFWVIGVAHRFGPEDRQRLEAFLSAF
ncbi:tetraacyldisaccharide 4'-kinase [Robiginitalea sp. M366]|uniref:tetraacyldisaccharide 4'-kinase n=1 Tax=Robiginitalea aestuariiviva TaxID=3036903 RepID=UPI00240DF328|nr:tetraacyldisaccharide 4'-kinase [Robiginitalea aestuariiviva]MDG1570766.1 tetraacyldisaccharide 4'-kinase [Robiginitalea aestuariiviva]